MDMTSTQLRVISHLSAAQQAFEEGMKEKDKLKEGSDDKEEEDVKEAMS